MRSFSCYYNHLENGKLVQNQNTACWAGLSLQYRYYKKVKPVENNGSYQLPIQLDELTKDYIYIEQYIEEDVSKKVRDRMVYLVNKITECKYIKINNIIYIKYKLLKNHYNNLLLLNFIRTLWSKQGSSFNTEKFFTDICERKPRNLDYLEFMMICVRDNVITGGRFNYGDHNFVYPNIIPKTKDDLLKYTGSSMSNFLQKAK